MESRGKMVQTINLKLYPQHWMVFIGLKWIQQPYKSVSYATSERSTILEKAPTKLPLTSSHIVTIIHPACNMVCLSLLFMSSCLRFIPWGPATSHPCAPARIHVASTFVHVDGPMPCQLGASLVRPPPPKANRRRSHLQGRIWKIGLDQWFVSIIRWWKASKQMYVCIVRR